tara:strand:+ start:923 stop:1222 length:300 start_codon:yes stop_codon:yes gene_type:complete
MLYSKFVIVGDNLIMVKCKFHRELTADINNVKGGGFFGFSNGLNGFIFSGSSHQFGSVTFEDIKRCVSLGNIYTSVSMVRKLKKHSFFYNNGSEIIKIN